MVVLRCGEVGVAVHELLTEVRAILEWFHVFIFHAFEWFGEFCSTGGCVDGEGKTITDSQSIRPL